MNKKRAFQILDINEKKINKLNKTEYSGLIKKKLQNKGIITPSR